MNRGSTTNGKNTSSSDGRTIDYTVFDKADLITKGNYRTRFDYGIGHSRYQRVDESKAPGASFSVDKITTYLGTVEYIEDLDSDESYYLRRIGGVANVGAIPGITRDQKTIIGGFKSMSGMI